MKSPQEVSAIIGRLKELYPDAACSLDYDKDYELLFSVRLAAQCTDARVNQVTPALFARFPTLESLRRRQPGGGGRIRPLLRLLAGQGPGHGGGGKNAAVGLRRAGAGQHGGPAAGCRVWAAKPPT